MAVSHAPIGASLTDGQRQAIESVVRASTAQIWFENNVGQFPAGVRYGFRTVFGAMLIYDDHLQIIARQTGESNNLLGAHSVNVTFVDGSRAWQIVPGGSSDVVGTYQQPDGSALHPEIYKELTLRNVYEGVDLRLYSAEKGALEFDWLLARAQDYNKIQIRFLGQDGIRFGADGSMTLDLRYQDLALNMPEAYQIIDGVKSPVNGRMVAGADSTVVRYEIAGQLAANQPLVIDPTIVWATYFDLNNGTLPFDAYNYAVAVNATGVYIGGWIREDVTNGSFGGYMDVNAGFSQDVLAGQFENYIYRFNGNGTAITAWTSTGRRNTDAAVANQKIDSATNDAIADMELFPDGRVLVGFASGNIQIYSSNLSNRTYDAEPVTMDTLNAVAPASNSSFYVSGRVSAAIPAGQIPAVNIGPDTVFAGSSEGVIIRYSNAATTPTPAWATYVGGNGAEYFTAIMLTSDGSNLAFTTNTAGGAAFPALVNDVDNTIAGTELLVGVLPNQATVPAAFGVFSYLGGTGDEGTIGTDTTASVLTATDTHFYVAGTTASPAAGMPGIAGGGQAANGGGAFDVFISRIPITGSAGTGFQTSFLGGDAEDRIGGIDYDTVADQLLIFGTTGGGTFPVVDTTPGSNYYDGSFGGGTWDIFVAIFNNTLTVKSFATFIGGNQNDYLGQTGELIGQGHVTYSSATGLSYLATTVHSTLPANAIGTPSGKDTSKSNGGNDSHTIFAFNINNYDYGDAPLSYDGGSTATAARSAISSTLRIGTTTDVEALPFSSTTALEDDQSNTGSSDDEDGVATVNVLSVGDTTYSTTVSVFNNSGVARTLQGWVDLDLDGAFQAGEYASVAVPTSGVQQSVALNWTGITVSGTGQRYLRLRLNDGALTDDTGTPGVDERSIGSTGTGEVEDYTILQVPQLSKAFSPSTIPTGSSSTLTISILNPSAISAQADLAFSDTFPVGMVVANPTGFSINGCGTPTYTAPIPGDTSVSFTGAGTIAAGGTCTITVNVTVSAAGTYINDNLTVSSANGIGTTSGAILDANTTSLAMTKTANPASGVAVNPGDAINYTIAITNTGTTVQNNIVVDDALPAGATYVVQSTVVNGYIVTTSNLTYLDQFGAAAFNNSNGTANWVGTPWIETNDDGVANTGKIQINTATAGVARFDATAQADVLTLTRPVNLTDAIAATLTYTLTETGNNNTTGAGGDYVEVEVYNGTTWTNLTTQNQNFATFNGNHNILAYANANTQIRFVVHGYDGGTNDARLDNVQIAYTMQSSSATIKDNLPAGANGDLTSGVPSTLVTAADDFDLRAGQSMTVSYSIIVDNPTTETKVDNTALVTSVEQTLPLQSATTHPISTPQADLAVTKTDGVASVNAGGAATYTIRVTNNGPSSVTGAILSDPVVTGLSKTTVACSGTPGQCVTAPTAVQLEGGAFTLPALTSGQFYEITVTANVTALSGSITNTATAITPAGVTDPDSTNNIADDTDTVNPVADLVVSKSDGVTVVQAGANTIYTLTLTNNGPSDANNATISDPAVTGLTKTAIGACAPTNGAVCPTVGVGVGQINIANLEAGSVVVPTLPSGGSVSFTVAVNVTALSGIVANVFTATPPPGITDPSLATSTDTDNIVEINAINDTGSVVNGTVGGQALASVLPNDRLNGASPILLADVILTQVSTTNAGVTLDPVTGAVNVAPGTPAGSYIVTYQICDVLNPTICDTATVTVPVVVIDAVDDDFSAAPISGYAGGTTPTVFVNDILNGIPFANADVLPSIANIGGLTGLTINSNGTLNVPAGTPADTYTITYQICDAITPTICDTATVTVVLNPLVIDAVDDDYSAAPINGYVGGNAGNAFTNDTLNGAAVIPAQITATVVTPASSAGVTLNTATGSVDVAAGTPAGTYTIDYQICETINPANCDTATVTVVVNPPVIVAVDDFASGVNGITGATGVLNVFTNDTLNGATVVPVEVALTETVSDPSGALNLNPNGSVDVAPGTLPGTYQLTYQICEVVNPANCDAAVATVVVGVPPAPVAQDDSTTTPFNTPVMLPNITANDTANGTGNSIVVATIDLDPGTAGQQTSLTDASGNIWSVSTLTGNVTFTPAANFTGTATIPYSVEDAAGQVATANLSVTVTPPASISGTVFNDADLNGSKAGGESGIVGVIVNLYDSSGITLISTTTTGPGGTYSFNNLIPGTYTVVEIDPAGYVSTTPNHVPVTVASGATGTADFGDYQLLNTALSSINGVVYNDLDGDGVQDPGELPLSGVTVDLKNNLGAVIGTAVTNASGAYGFNNLPAGAYTVVETDPGGFTSTTLNTVAVTLSAGTSATVNFGDQAGSAQIADPALTKLGSPTSAQVGDIVVYTITVGNNGSANAANVVLTDTKPAFLDIISVTITPNPGLTPVISGNTFTINFGTVTPADLYTITVLTRVNTQGVPPGGVNNASIVTSSPTDRAVNNASAAALTIPAGTSPASAIGSLAQVTQLPATGFAPNRLTTLPPQPKDRLYAPTSVVLEIPALGVKVPIVGVPKQDGAWDVAWLGRQAGWLEGSAFPSWAGNSVLTGHVYDANGKPGPFVNLNKLKYGDKIIVRFNGQKYIFEVRTNQIVNPADTSAFRHEELSWVTLITCREYDQQTDTYKQRVVVRAVLVSVTAEK